MPRHDEPKACDAAFCAIIFEACIASSNRLVAAQEPSARDGLTKLADKHSRAATLMLAVWLAEVEE